MKKEKTLKIILVVALLISMFNISGVRAKDNTLSITNVILSDKSNTVETNISNYENNKIDSNIVYHKLNDYVEYTITIKNNENKEVKINGITMESPYKYVEYEYDSHEGDIFKANESKDIKVKATYKNESEYNGSSNEGAKLIVSYVIDGKDNNVSIPLTYDNITFNIVILIISSMGLLSLVVLKKKNNKLLLIGLLLIPVVTKALNVDLTMSFKNDIKIQDKQTVKINVDGIDQDKIVPYGETLEKPTDPVKEGYKFLGWFEGDNLYSFDREIKDDVKIVAKYEANNVKYRVIRKLQNIENDGYTIKEEEELPGKYDEEVTPVVKNYDGYQTPEVQKVQIKNNSEIIYEYKRNTHKVRYSYTNTTLPKNVKNLPSEQTFKYGAEVNVAPVVQVEGYTFEWNKNNTFTMPDNDVEITGTFTAQQVNYKVKHYIENSSGEFELVDEETKQGLTDTQAIASPKTDLEGYIYDNTLENTVSSGNIEGDSSLVLKLYYRLKKHTLKFNANGGTTNASEVTVNYGEKVESLPSAEKDGLMFVGWFTKPTGVNDSNQILEDTVLDEDMEVYAHYKGTVCKRATTLHQNYGTIQSGETIKAGDAYDCDVNGDGVFNSDKERFYYLRTDENNNALLIYSNMTSASLPNYTDGCADGKQYAFKPGTSTIVNNLGPNYAYTEIPDKDTWSNVFLPNNGLRDILSIEGKKVTTFKYANRAGRYLTMQDLFIACNYSYDKSLALSNPPSNCPFLFENLSNGCRTNYVLETPGYGTTDRAYRLFKDYVQYTGTKSATRPVIEVPIQLVEVEGKKEVEEEIVVHDIMHSALRTYYDNIDSWTEGQTESNHSNYDSQMLKNLKANNCAYTTSENNRDFYANGSTQYCDQPNKYDTGIRSELKVYSYNEKTKEKGAEATYVTANNGYIYNMIPDETYYFEDINNSSNHGYVKASGERRIISIDNQENTSKKIYKVRNVRDLGGIKVTYQDENNKTVNGIIKYQKLYRGEKIWGGDGKTKELFDKLGINHEMDLRESSEASSVAYQEDRLEYNVTRANTNVFEAKHYELRYDSERTYYNKTREAVTKVMQEFVNAHNNGDDSYSLYFHCRIGNDRTGTLAYLLEGLLGASTEERYRDYELSYYTGFTYRTRFYEASQDGKRHTKFNYLKKAIRDAGDGVNEDVLTWYLLGSTNTEKDMNLIQQFRKVMVQEI